MKTIIVVGGSKGIGNALVQLLVKSHNVINISRTEPQISHENLKHISCNVLTDEY
jgi:short-subunit dehydrogenase